MIGHSRFVPVFVLLAASSTLGAAPAQPSADTKVDSPTMPVDIPELPSECRMTLGKIKKGITRAELEKSAHPDAGATTPFRKERYVINHCDGLNVRMPKGVLKLELQMKPAGMSSAVFAKGKWSPPKPSPNDRLESLSDLYWQDLFN
jgi:hypothetical protein